MASSYIFELAMLNLITGIKKGKRSMKYWYHMSVASSTKAFYSRNSDVNLFIAQKLQSVSGKLKFCQHFDDIIENESVKFIEGTNTQIYIYI